MSVTSLELQIEREKNVFTQFYTPAYQPKQPKKKEVINEVQQALRDFKHKYALNFACTSLLIWRKIGYLDFPKLKKSTSHPAYQIPPTDKVFAFYRVISEFSDKYLLTACHVNVHGYHRGDLRFIEINNRTVTRGIPEGEHCLGRLFIGDIVAVTGMARMKNFEEYTIFDITKDSDCTWMATNITVLPRSSKTDATFSLLKNGTAVVKEHSEVMNVDSPKPLKIEILYTGSAFLPEKMATNYCMDFQPDRKNELIYTSSKVHQYPNALGTIFKFEEAPELTKMFEIGTDAFLYSSASEILETCVLMGYAAANSITNGRFDSRSFPMENIDRKGPIVKFQIDNPPDNPTEGKWTINSRIRISGPTGECNAIIETVILQKNRLSITSRLSREVPNREKFKEGLFIVYQREAPESQILRTGFFEKVPSRSNGRKILEVLYGADPLENPKNQAIFQYFFPGKEGKLKLNYYQCEYVSMLLNPEIPIVVGSSPFGCGKSMTIVTAALEIYKNLEAMKKKDKKKNRQLLVTQSNYASVNLVDISGKIYLEDHQEEDNKLKFVRFVSEKNWKELPLECLTDYDLPLLMEQVFLDWATVGCADEPEGLEERHKSNMVLFLTKEKKVDPAKFNSQALRFHSQTQQDDPWRSTLLEAFFLLYNPDIIMTTADSLQTLLSSRVLKPEDVYTIQIDEASQVPEYTFISLLTQFPKATYGLIGDIQQLPPYCETGLDGKLKDYGIGNTMERCVEEELFPQAMLREVYRCHPKITGLLSDLFYKGKLISGVTEAMRSQFMEKRTDFWPGSKYPVLLVNNNESGYKMGTSCGNTSEKLIVQKLLDLLCKQHNGYELEPTQIGVISFYSAQTSVLTEALRGRQVKCGTVDAFQGTERDVIVLCCTNEKISEFMQMSNRINVAMSRAKQVTIIVGNLNGLKKASYWKEIVKKAQENGCVMEARSILNTSGPPAGRRQRNRRNNNENAAQKKFNFNESVQNRTIEKTPTVPLPEPPKPAAPKNDLTDLLNEMNLLKIAISNYKLQEQLQQQQS
ncbi:hypothetical protein B9Z55_007606 [Caenorhabditis nigoni]|uniref:DNA2/NAM7 helicase-like C-terminal domain-containing protein n=1 Tax=Caenorhabditis nigoni TaxID=1611254 RepID=A0A2G5VAF1_9PELO|nr:hypothetical protein B9Z55_007606 [Caenorhabditis nigoni]